MTTRILDKMIPILAVTFAFAAFGDTQGKRWGLEELKLTQGLALDKFKADQGEDLYKAIVGLSADLNIQATSSKVKVTYKDAQGLKKTVSYFCHEHSHEGEEVEIDCH